MKQILWIGFGGFLGTIARYLVSKLNIYWHFLSIPMGTLTVNVIGSLLIGILVGIAQKGDFFSPTMRLFLMVGVCGGFTTFSSFSNENFMLFQNGQFTTALIYTGMSIILGFTAVYIGFVISNLF